MNQLYFYSKALPTPRGEYVAWFDGMGTGRALSTSLAQAANFVMKLHIAFALAPTPPAISRFPMMDGMYIASSNRRVLEDYLRKAFVRLAAEFCAHQGASKRFLVRCGLAYGASVHGSSVKPEAFGDEKRNGMSDAARRRIDETRSGILLNAAMVSAVEAEAHAPPFGVFVHESALTLPQTSNARDRGFPSRLWRWWGNDAAAEAAARKLAPEVEAHFKEARAKSAELGYPSERADAHHALAKEYFAGICE